MDMLKMGVYLKKLRNEKNLTQEELSEKFGVTRRTVSRWETGYNLPDIDILIEMLEFYNVELKELLQGGNNNMENKEKETAMLVDDYNKTNNNRSYKVVLIYLSLGIICLIINQILSFIKLPETFWVGFAKGATAGLALLSLIFAILYITGKLNSIKDAKKKIWLSIISFNLKTY